MAGRSAGSRFRQEKMISSIRCGTGGELSRNRAVVRQSIALRTSSTAGCRSNAFLPETIS